MHHLGVRWGGFWNTGCNRPSGDRTRTLIFELESFNWTQNVGNCLRFGILILRKQNTDILQLFWVSEIRSNFTTLLKKIKFWLFSKHNFGLFMSNCKVFHDQLKLKMAMKEWKTFLKQDYSAYVWRYLIKLRTQTNSWRKLWKLPSISEQILIYLHGSY